MTDHDFEDFLRRAHERDIDSRIRRAMARILIEHARDVDRLVRIARATSTVIGSEVVP